MTQADFIYDAVCDSAGFQLTVTILADRAAVRTQMREDAVTAGLDVRDCCTFAEYAEGPLGALGDIVLVDCMAPDAGAMALLARLDLRAGQSGARIIASTDMASLDAVFGCLAMAETDILVDAGRADRVIAIGRSLAQVPNLRLRELVEEDRMMILRLTEQVGQLAQRIERGGPGQRAGGGAFRLEAARSAYHAEAAHGSARHGLPAAGTIRSIIRARQARARYFEGDLFADPAWDILLDLAAAHAEGSRVSVTSLCIAAGVPPTTALRWIGQLVDSGLLLRMPDPADRRRAHVALAPPTLERLIRLFADVGVEAGRPLALI